MTEADQLAVSDSFEGLEGMNMPVAAFVEAFKTNPLLVRKIALVTGFEEHLLKSIPEEELLSTFAKWDAEGSGNLSFDNFVQGLSKMRQFNRSAQEQAQAAEEQAVLDASVQEAKDAFVAAGGGQGSELDLQAFLVALSDMTLVNKIAAATGLPTSFFENLSVRQLLDLFKEVDLDASGTISLEEWIEALVRIRMTIYDERKAELDAAMDAVRKHAEAALNEGDEDWSGEFDFREFITAFKCNPTFVRKVSLATGISVEELGTLQEDSIEDLFLALDTDYSGTVSFTEFVKGLAEIRLIRKARVDQDREMQERAMLDEALTIAADAFESADLTLEGELDLQTFMQALGNAKVAEKVSQATSVPAEWFLSLDVHQMVELFQDIDADANGKVSFSEWVLALLRVRHANHEDQKAEQQQELAAITSLVEEALEEGDEDWSGELDFREFIAAFRSNPRFVRKVALATDATVEDLNSLASEDLEQFFALLDTDRSGTISFEEFVHGLLDIRMKRHAYAKEQAEAENQAVIDVAYLDALDAFSQADLGVTGELDLDSFHKALQQPAILEKVAVASQLPPEFFSKLSKQDIQDIFSNMDTDRSGGISFNEWVAAIVNTRQEVYLTEKLEQEHAIAAVMGDAAAAMDEVLEDWSGEFELQRFIAAFQTNEAFVRKVSHATGIPTEEYQRLQASDLKDLFDALDMDFSGTVSFSEFVEGLAAIRRAHEAAILEEVPSPKASDGQKVVKDAVAEAAPSGMETITPEGLRQLLVLLDDKRWTPSKLDKLVAGLPWSNGELPLSKMVDLLY